MTINGLHIITYAQPLLWLDDTGRVSFRAMPSRRRKRRSIGLKAFHFFREYILLAQVQLQLSPCIAGIASG